jgi:hypothetical protein
VSQVSRAQSEGNLNPRAFRLRLLYLTRVKTKPTIPNGFQCDRSIPCHACIIRGLEAECSYTATAEDRAHISQADIIERLRREVAQLRGRLNQPREPSQTKSWRQHPYAPASVSAGSSSRRGGRGNDGQYSTGLETEESWRGSSPSSSTTTMTNSVTVTSPDSTGSPCELGARSVSSRSASASAPASAPAPASASVSVSVSAYLVPTGYAPQVAEFDRSSNDAVAFGRLFPYLSTLQGCVC